MISNAEVKRKVEGKENIAKAVMKSKPLWIISRMDDKILVKFFVIIEGGNRR